MGLFLFISLASAGTVNILYYNDADTLYYTHDYDSASCVPEPKTNGREVICTPYGPYIPPDNRKLNNENKYSGVTNCFWQGPGNAEGHYYLDSYCGKNPNDNTYFYNTCYYPGTWTLQTFSDSACTQLISSNTVQFGGFCVANATENSSKTYFCAIDSWRPTTTMTTTSTSAPYNGTYPPNQAAFITFSGWTFCLLLLLKELL